MRIYVVTLFEIGYHFLHSGRGTLEDQLVVTALGTHVGAGGHKYLEFGIGKDRGADVAPVHHHAAVGTEGVQMLVHPAAHERNRRNRTHVRGDFHRTDFLFDVATTAEKLGSAIVRPLEMQVVTCLQLFPEAILVDALGTDQTFLHCKQGHSPVHCPGIEVQKTETLRNELCEGALAGRGPSVHGNDDVGYLYHTKSFTSFSLTGLPPRMRRRSTTLRSSRILPGQ